MNNIKYFLLLMVCFYHTVFAADTYCEADGGVHHSILVFTGTKISAAQNKTGKTINQNVDNGEQYKGVCHCNRNYSNVYYTAEDNPALQKTSMRSNVQYYNLDEYLDVGLSIKILGRGYLNVPFNNKPNEDGSYTCTNNKNTTTFTSGSDAIIYFYIKEPFIGTVNIPATLLASLYATTSSLNPENTHKLSDVYIQGDITAPQECVINGGQTIEVDFGKILASEFSSTPGSALTDKKIPITASVKCTGMSSGQGVEVALHATQAGSLPTVIETSNADVGIKMYDELNNEVDVNGGRMETEMGSRSRLGEEDGEFIFSAAPASATGTRPKPGQFDASVTITMEIKN
ncbi:fimbrial protein [Salmonella bongori]|uniref:fimbrial protein n=1 Tax=Salmonella bongori TaxID=54736 RepID=UPI00112F0E9F|nr:fimbrial protein [Salmonella bongori]EGE4656119.1 fimbrial protein [Salmonella bongori serovar 40:z35:- str. 95-0123]ECG9254963.1 fimbrial protein [Salmonella bongori]EDP8663981.1 fimbrial protein [Salmonella bongori]EDP8708514.1 fimbrial protein [Salmonella bongori]EDP8726402.1 fimbrial protein [Salmonella bongori]